MKTYRLECALVSHVITEEGDFIPKGTPVIVIGWKDETGNNASEILVYATAYMYADTLPDYKDDKKNRIYANVGPGIYISVKPEQLEYYKFLTFDRNV